MSDLLFQSCFLGFSLLTIILIVISAITKNDKTKTFIIGLDEASVFTVQLAGIVFFIVSLIYVYTDFTESEESRYSILNRMFGPYWFGYWLYPFSYIFLTQLLWIKSIKNIKWFRIIFALIILFTVSIERITIVITSFHMDYLSGVGYASNSYLFTVLFFLNLLSKLGYFLLIVAVVYLIKSRIGLFYSRAFEK